MEAAIDVDNDDDTNADESEDEDKDEAAYLAVLVAALATSIKEERLKVEAEEADYQARLAEAIALSATTNVWCRHRRCLSSPDAYA